MRSPFVVALIVTLAPLGCGDSAAPWPTGVPSAAATGSPQPADGAGAVSPSGGPDPAPSASPDAGVDDAAPGVTDSSNGPPVIPHGALLHAGLHPDASDALRFIGITKARITQTIGNAPASAGTHGVDGQASGLDYSAAVDLRASDLTDAEIRALLIALGNVGFAAWFRNPGHDGWPAADALHIHAVYAGCPMKLSLRNQIHDFCAGKNGLASHTVYAYAAPQQSAIDRVRSIFLAHNPSTL